MASPIDSSLPGVFVRRREYRGITWTVHVTVRPDDSIDLMVTNGAGPLQLLPRLRALR